MTADLRDAAAEATRLALAMGSDAPDAVSFVAKLCSKFPLVAPVLETLKSIREKLDELKAKKEELVALNKRCVCQGHWYLLHGSVSINSVVIVKYLVYQADAAV